MISIWGTIVLFTCVLVVPAAEVVMTTAAALGKNSASIETGRFILKHFAMLDVLCVGMVLSVLASKCEPDIKCALLPNFLYMLGATAMWYFHHALCEAALNEKAKDQRAGLLPQGQ